jgi:hypothetical protein
MNQIRHCSAPLQEIEATKVSPEALPYIAEEADRPGNLLIRPSDKAKFVAAGYKVLGTFSTDNLRKLPMLRVAPPPKKVAQTEFDDSQSYAQFTAELTATLERGLVHGISKEIVKVLAARAVAAF